MIGALLTVVALVALVASGAAALLETVTRRGRAAGSHLGQPLPHLSPASQRRGHRTESSWERGARGERVTAEALDRTGLIALHDRAWPGKGSANIDHVVVGPAAIYVVDAKNYNSGPLWAGDHALRIGRRDETALLRSVAGQASQIRSQLRRVGVEVPVVPVLCFTGSSAPTPGARIRNVHLTTPGRLPSLVFSSGGAVPTPARAHQLADLIAWLCPPA